MSKVFVFGVDDESLDRAMLLEDIREVFTTADEPRLHDDVVVYCVADIGANLDQVAVIVEGVNVGARTRQALSESLGNAVRKWCDSQSKQSRGALLNAAKLTVQVRRLDPEDGFFECDLQ